jgi:hypothetical protein
MVADRKRLLVNEASVKFAASANGAEDICFQQARELMRITGWDQNNPIFDQQVQKLSNDFSCEPSLASEVMKILNSVEIVIKEISGRFNFTPSSVSKKSTSTLDPEIVSKNIEKMLRQHLFEWADVEPTLDIKSFFSGRLNEIETFRPKTNKEIALFLFRQHNQRNQRVLRILNKYKIPRWVSKFFLPNNTHVCCTPPTV